MGFILIYVIIAVVLTIIVRYERTMLLRMAQTFDLSEGMIDNIIVAIIVLWPIMLIASIFTGIIYLLFLIWGPLKTLINPAKKSCNIRTDWPDTLSIPPSSHKPSKNNKE